MFPDVSKQFYNGMHATLDSDVIQVVPSLYKLGSPVFPPILPVRSAFLIAVPLGSALQDPVLLSNAKTIVFKL